MDQWVVKSAWVSGLQNRHGSGGCKIGVDRRWRLWPWVWVVLGLLANGLGLLAMSGVGFASFSFSGGGGLDECGCG
ncbi:hypothetical protein CMV_005829 [Castanea mollissima]|uniref:Uncharacterized protein n=1 Tax=Castanea mollissima TaxID=60419 RepID=A0A8J4RPQ2_9ROSI|nr:hypothetical protein CMV_005829 [Castanea mollissima]